MSGSKTYRPKYGYDIRINPDPPQRVQAAQSCSITGCTEPAEWRAPKTRENMTERVWFCRQHLRAHNEHWNFFAGMSEDEIQRHCIESIFGHRPTWPLGKRKTKINGAEGRTSWTYRIEDDFAIFEENVAPPRPRLTKAQLDALNIMGLEQTSTLREIKARYKELVKRFHPDANGGNRETEERLRQVIKAYGYLRATGLVRSAP